MNNYRMNVPVGAEDKRMTRQPGAARSLQAVCHMPGQAELAAATGCPLGALARVGMPAGLRNSTIQRPAFTWPPRSSGQMSVQLALFPIWLFTAPQL